MTDRRIERESALPDRLPSPPRKKPATSQQGAAAAGATRTRLPLVVTLFMISLIIPVVLQLGPLRLSFYRLVLLVTVLPSLLMWMQGRAGPIRLADIGVLFFCFWSGLSLFVIHGAGYAVEPTGMFFIETAGAYFIARCHIRTADDFEAMVRLLFKIILILLPFAIIEALTTHNLILTVFGAVLKTHADIFMDPRLGMRRVQGPFEHPILFGVFCGSAIGLTFMVLGYGKSLITKWRQTLLVAFTAFFCLSSGPLTAITAQFMMIGWNTVMRWTTARWKILIGLILTFWILIELFANRSAPEIFIAYFAFDGGTAWNRLLIWHFGSLSVVNHPLLGIGMNDWERPDWMVASMDMFWLVPAVRHGLPAIIALFTAVFSLYIGVALRKKLPERVRSYRLGYLFAMTGFFIAGWTVHYWNETYVLLMFLMGSGAWILDVKADVPAQPATVRSRTRRKPQTADAVAGPVNAARLPRP